MSVVHGRYRVVDRFGADYRGHALGVEFVARLDALAEQRAIDRGAIELLERITPALPDEYALPEGWATLGKEE